MREATANRQMEAYSEAIKSGLYAKASGLLGKYDNVRRYWEDEITRQCLYPYVEELISRTQPNLHRLRIMDLGCGSADGYELLTGIRRRDADLHDVDVSLLRKDALECYKGVDLNADLLRQASQIHGDNPKMTFEQADFTQGLPLSKNEKPYDLYLMSYGTASHHNDDETLICLLAEIAERTERCCLIVCDWIGRYSYEWQTLWTRDLSQNRNMDYVVSYIYEEQERQARRDQLQHLTLRLMGRSEAEEIVARASEGANVEIKPLSFFDRSTFTGRHMDTAEYNPHAQPIRRRINSLLEPNVRTPLELLKLHYVPKAGLDFLNNYFEHLQTYWNLLVHYVEQLLAVYDPQRRRFRSGLPPICATYPPVLRKRMTRMRLVVERLGWMHDCLPRENIIEPQLAHALRSLVTSLQQGQGCAHGLVGVFEVDKSR